MGCLCSRSRRIPHFTNPSYHLRALSRVLPNSVNERVTMIGDDDRRQRVGQIW
jgi:hypothetical protein